MRNKAMLGVFKAQESSKGGLTIEGWANKAIVDRGGDIIPKSAWDLENFKKNSIILFNHDKNQPIGKAVSIEPRDEGLYVKAKISASADPGISKVRDLIKEGVLNAFSVGFDSIDEAKSADGHNEIRAAELFEISVVSIPMNQDSLFSLSKSYDLGEIRKKAAELYEASNGSPAVDAKAAKKPEEEAAAEGEDQNNGDPAESAPPSEGATASEDKPQDPPEDGETGDEPVAKKEVELRIQAIRVPKSAFASLEAAAQFVAEGGYSVEYATEEGDFYLFQQAPVEQFMATAELPLDEELGIVAVVGSAKLEMPEAEMEDGEGEDAGEEKTKELPTQALPEAPPVGSDNVTIQAAQQTNILLGQLVAETQAVKAAIVELMTVVAMIPKQAPVPVEPPKPETQPPPPPEKESEEAVAKLADLVRQSVEETRLKIQALERRDAQSFNSLGEYR